jgi:hypothetical protein
VLPQLFPNWITQKNSHTSQMIAFSIWAHSLTFMSLTLLYSILWSPHCGTKKSCETGKPLWPSAEHWFQYLYHWDDYPIWVSIEIRGHNPDCTRIQILRRCNHFICIEKHSLWIRRVGDQDDLDLSA